MSGRVKNAGAETRAIARDFRLWRARFRIIEGAIPAQEDFTRRPQTPTACGLGNDNFR
jgi:hypothetical protein